MTEMHSFELCDSAVHVWHNSLSCPEKNISSFAELLSPDELLRARRYHFLRDRRRFIIGRATLRLLLARYLEQDARSIQFRYGSHGKPRVGHSETTLSFNLSHSDELVLYCFSKNKKVGIDVEHVQKLLDYDSIAAQVLCKKELSMLESTPPESRDLLFLRMWTRKESLLKALGIGISDSMKNTNLSSLPILEHDSVWRPMGTLGTWSFYDLTPNSYYVGALSTDSPASSLKVQTFPLNFNNGMMPPYSKHRGFMNDLQEGILAKSMHC